MAILKISPLILESDRGTDLVCALMDHFDVYTLIGFDERQTTLTYRVERSDLPTDDTEVYCDISYVDDEIQVATFAPVFFDINSCSSIEICAIPISKKTVP